MLHATSPQSMNVAVSGSTSAIRSTHQNLVLEVRNRVLLRAGLDLVTIVLQGMRTDPSIQASGGRSRGSPCDHHSAHESFGEPQRNGHTHL